MSLPLNPAGQKAAAAWDPAKDEAAGEQCRAYGAGGIMRMPTRLRISWQDDTTLKLETDAGTQTRLLRFGARRWRSRQLAGRLVGVVGVPARRRSRPAASAQAPRRPATARRLDEGGDDADAARLPAAERRALQRQRRDDRVLRSPRRARRRLAAASWPPRSPIPNTWRRPTGPARSSSGRPTRAAGTRRRARRAEGDTPMMNVRAIVCAAAALSSRDALRPAGGPGTARRHRPSPAIDLSGYWTPVMHEDALERGAGNEIADYGGFALNEAGRLWALSYDPSRVTLRHHQCEGYVAPYQMRSTGNFRIWEERDPAHAAADRHPRLRPDHRRPPHHLDGRAAASARLGAAHGARLLHRPLRRQRRSSCRPRTSSRAGCAATACPAATRRR